MRYLFLLLIFLSQLTLDSYCQQVGAFRAKRYIPFDQANIIVDGNSLSTSAGTGIAWPAKMDAIHPFDANSATITNIAVSGQNTRNMLADAASQVDGAFDESKVNVVIAWEIRNDIVAGQTIQQALDSFEQYCSERREAGFYVVVLTLTPSWRDDYGVGGEVGYNQLEADRLAVNDSLRKYHKNYSDLLIDIGDHPQLGQTGANEPDGWQFSDGRMGPTTLYHDGTHFTDAGKDLIAAMVRGKLLGMSYKLKPDSVVTPASELIAFSPEQIRMDNIQLVETEWNRGNMWDGVLDDNISVGYEDWYDKPRFEGDSAGMQYMRWFGGRVVVDSIGIYHTGDSYDLIFQKSLNPVDTAFRTFLTVNSAGFNNQWTYHDIVNDTLEYLQLTVQNRNLKTPDDIAVYGHYIDTPDYDYPAATENNTRPLFKDFLGINTFFNNYTVDSTADENVEEYRLYQDARYFMTDTVEYGQELYGHADPNVRASFTKLAGQGTVYLNPKAGSYQCYNCFEYTSPNLRVVETGAGANVTITHNLNSKIYGVNAHLASDTSVQITPAGGLVTRNLNDAIFPVPAQYQGEDLIFKVADESRFSGNRKFIDNEHWNGFAYDAWDMYATAVYHYVAIYGFGDINGGDVTEGNKLTKLRLEDTSTPVNQGKIEYILIGNELQLNWEDEDAFHNVQEVFNLIVATYEAAKLADPGIKVILGPSHQHNPAFYERLIRSSIALRGENNFPWDGWSFNHYSNDAQGEQNGASTRGVHPEGDIAISKIQQLIDLKEAWCPTIELFIGEYGYDTNGSKQQVNSVGSLSQNEMQGALLLRSVLEYLRIGGIDGTFQYMIRDVTNNNNNTFVYNNSGLTYSLNNDLNPKFAWYAFKQFKDLIGNYTYESTTVAADSMHTAQFDSSGVKAYVVWMGTYSDSVLTNVTLPIDAGLTQVVEAVIDSTSITATLTDLTVTSNQVTINVNEIPRIIKSGVAPVGVPPSNIALSNQSIAENSANGTVIGALSADGDTPITFTLKTVDDYANYSISGSDLTVNTGLDYETNPSDNITVVATNDEASVEASFTITITDVNESYIAPTAFTHGTESFTGNGNISGETVYYNVFTPDNITNSDLVFIDLAGYSFRDNASTGNVARGGATLSQMIDADTPASGDYAHVWDCAAVLTVQSRVWTRQQYGDGAYQALADWASKNGKTVANLDVVVVGMSYGGEAANYFTNDYADQFNRIIHCSVHPQEEELLPANRSALWGTDVDVAYFLSSTGDSNPSTLPDVVVDWSTGTDADGADTRLYISNGGVIGGHAGANDEWFVISGKLADYDWSDTNPSGNMTGNATYTPPNTIAQQVYDPYDKNMVEEFYEDLNITNTGFQVILPANVAPTNLALSNSAINENLTGFVGTLSADGFPAPTFAISGGADQTDFTLVNSNELHLLNAKDFEVDDITLEVQVTASNTEAPDAVLTFTINILDVAEGGGGSYAKAFGANFGRTVGDAGFADFVNLSDGSAEWASGDIQGSGMELHKANTHIINGYYDNFGVNVAGDISPADVNRSFWRRNDPITGPLELTVRNVTGTPLNDGDNVRVKLVIADDRGSAINCTVIVEGVTVNHNAEDNVNALVVDVVVGADNDIDISIDQTSDASWGKFINALEVHLENSFAWWQLVLMLGFWLGSIARANFIQKVSDNVRLRRHKIIHYYFLFLSRNIHCRAIIWFSAVNNFVMELNLNIARAHCYILKACIPAKLILNTQIFRQLIYFLMIFASLRVADVTGMLQIRISREYR